MIEEAEALKKQLRFLEERRGGKKGPRANAQPMPAGEDNVF
jgi:hypothetical protein